MYSYSLLSDLDRDDLFKLKQHSNIINIMSHHPNMEKTFERSSQLPLRIALSNARPNGWERWLDFYGLGNWVFDGYIYIYIYNLKNVLRKNVQSQSIPRVSHARDGVQCSPHLQQTESSNEGEPLVRGVFIQTVHVFAHLQLHNYMKYENKHIIHN